MKNKESNKGKRRLTFWGMLIALLTCVIFNCYSVDKFELSPTKINFTGAIGTRSSIIVFGTQGTYLISWDWGKNWETFQLYPYGTIWAIINSDDTLYGVMENGFLMTSYNFGKDWEILNIKTREDEKFINIVANGEYLYVRTNFGINRYEKDGKFVNSIVDERLYIEHIGAPQPPYLPPPPELSPLTKPTFFIINDKILLNTKDEYKDGLEYIPLDLSGIKYKNLRDKLKQNDTSPSYWIGNNAAEIKNGLFLFDILGLYITDSILNKWEYFFPDTLFFNPRFRDKYIKMIRPTFYEEYFLDNWFYRKDTLFIGYYCDTNDREMRYSQPTFGSANWPGPLGKYRIFYFNRDSIKFLPYGNFFDNIYYTPKDHSIPNQSRIEFISQMPHYLINDSIIIKASLYNTILISTNGGKDWKLISSLNGEPNIIINDSTFIYVNPHINKNDIDISINGGITFMPTELALDTEIVKKYIADSNLVIVDSICVKKIVSYFAGAEKTRLIFIDSSGKGFWFGNQYDSNYPEFAYTRNFGKNFKFEKFSIGNLTASNVLRIDSHFVFTASFFGPSPYYDTLFYSFYFLDTSFEKNKRIFYNSMKLFAVNYIIRGHKDDSYILFGLAQDTAKVTRFQIREVDTTGNILTILHKFDERIDIIQFYQHNADSVFFTTAFPDRLYLYDRKSNELKTLWNNEESFYSPLLMVISDRFYLVGRELFLENTNRSDLTQWREGKWDYGKPNFESVIFKGNVAIAGLSDSLRPFNYYKITLKKDTTTNVEDSQLDVRYYTTHFYATEPYPLPASSVVKSKIYTDGSFDLNQAIDGVYDVMGNKVEGKQRITIKELGKATAELTWNCSGVPSGIYFIVVRHNGQADTIPVIVE